MKKLDLDEKYIKKFGLKDKDDLEEMLEKAFAFIVEKYSDNVAINAKVAEYNGVSVDALIMSPHYPTFVKQYVKSKIKQECIDTFVSIGFEKEDAEYITSQGFGIAGF